jgi:hypothetical protein
MNQGLLWQQNSNVPYFAELCNALYEREIRQLAEIPQAQINALPARLKSLPHYIKRTAFQMLQCDSPLTCDVQNASWSVLQPKKMPFTGQQPESVYQWYSKTTLCLGLVVPVAYHGRIFIDCIDKISTNSARFRCNAFGWFTVEHEFSTVTNEQTGVQILKPTKQVMMSACAGHVWLGTKKQLPEKLSLRELLLSCQINWQNFKKVRKLID